MVTIDYTGSRFVLGRTADGYAIWEIASSGEPPQLFPATPEGWTAAWLKFRELEGGAPPAAAGSGGTAGAVRPLGLGSVLDGTFKVYGRHLGAFALVVAAVTIPLALIQIVVLRAFLSPELELLFSGAVSQTDLDVIRRTLEDDLPLLIAAGVVVGLISLFVSAIVSSALIGGTLRGVGGAAVRAGELLRSGVRRMASMAWILFLTGLIMFLAALPVGVVLFLASEASEGAVIILVIALFLVLLLLYTRYLFAPTTLIAEDRRGPQALRRSWELTRGRTWPTLGMFLVVGLIALVPNLLISLPFQLIAREQESLAMFWVFAALGGAVASVVIVPFTTVAIVHLYIDARARKEQLDPHDLVPDSGIGAR